MDFTEYQNKSRRTLNEPTKENRLIRALGLVGEAGEVADLIKKWEGHGHDVNPAKLAEELGDLLWYVAAVATTYGIDLSEAAAGNVAKLEARYPDGFSNEASRTRTR
jgi:NTP pyrophosphatase (non-canonical NTP hydrolase)